MGAFLPKHGTAYLNISTTIDEIPIIYNKFSLPVYFFLLGTAMIELSVSTLQTIGLQTRGHLMIFYLIYMLGVNRGGLSVTFVPRTIISLLVVL